MVAWDKALREGCTLDEVVVRVMENDLLHLLKERDQMAEHITDLQTRGTELVEENRKLKAYAATLAFVGRSVGQGVNREAIQREHPELFENEAV